MRISSSHLSRYTSSQILNKQHEIAKLQEQLSTGKRINRPSDDPALAARSVELRQASSQLDQYLRNTNFAEARLSLEETALTSVSNVLMRMKELALSASTDTTSVQDNDIFSIEVEQQLAELIDYANSTDNSGNYIFAGNKATTRPFNGNGVVTYAGDDESRSIQIGANRTVTSSHSGNDVFQRIRNGNGDFSLEADAANTGTALIPTGSVTDHSSFLNHEYSIQFTSSSTFDITDMTTGSTVLTNAGYTENENIEFAGINISISGNPANGDSFSVKPGQNQSLFQTVNNFIEVLSNTPTNDSEKAQYRQKMNNVISDLDQSFEHITSLRSEVGTRLRYIESSRDENGAISFQMEKTLAEIEGLDYADAISRLQLGVTTLETLQKTFSRIEGLSVFNYLR